MVPTPVVRSTLPIMRPQAQPTLASTGARSRPANVSNGSSRLREGGPTGGGLPRVRASVADAVGASCHRLGEPCVPVTVRHGARGRQPAGEPLVGRSRTDGATAEGGARGADPQSPVRSEHVRAGYGGCRGTVGDACSLLPPRLHGRLHGAGRLAEAAQHRRGSSGVGRCLRAARRTGEQSRCVSCSGSHASCGQVTTTSTA